jgi:hypothetical protein
MASLLLGGLIALAAAASSKSKDESPKPKPAASQGTKVPDTNTYDASSLVYIPEASMDKHPGNLPTHVPVYGDPETDPHMANTYKWQKDAWQTKETGSFEDNFHEYTEDSTSTIRNRMRPEGLLPHFKRKLQSTLYIPAQEPYEFKPPKAELMFEEMHGSPWFQQNNVHGGGPYYLYDDRYAQMSAKSNSAQGARDDYTLWDDPKAAACKTKTDLELDNEEARYIQEQGGQCTSGWFGTKGITQRFEGYHPRVRVFPRKESYMSTNPQLYDRPGIADVGPEGGKVAQLGRYEVPSNADVDEYHVEPLPTDAPAPRQARLGSVVLKNTYRSCTNVAYANHGALDLGEGADAETGRRVNRNVPPVTKKQLLTNTASSMNFMNYDDTQKLTGRNPLMEVVTRRVTPNVRMDIDESLLAPYLSNPYTQPITNLQYPMNQSCGKVEATEGLPAYAMASA